VAFEIDSQIAYAAKVIGGSIAGALMLLRVKPVKTIGAIISSVACSVALGGVFGPPTNDYLVANAILDWQHGWVGATSAIWALIGLALVIKFFKWLEGLDIGALILRVLQSGKGK
jgi:hypothetical protein